MNVMERLDEIGARQRLDRHGLIVVADARDLLDAVRAVLALHICWEEDDAAWCTHCADLTYGEDWDAIKWPCATVRAIEGALR